MAEKESAEEKKQQQNRSVSFRVKTKEAEAANVGKGALMGADSDEEENHGKR